MNKNGEYNEFEYGYDPRVCKIDGKYYVTWCNSYKGFPTIGIAETTDFENFVQYENAFLPFNRNGVLFPRKINGKYAMISRPSDKGHTPFGEIFFSESPDMTYWGKHRLVMVPTSGWQETYELCHDRKYYDYAKKWVDSEIREDGTIINHNKNRFDDLMAGCLLFMLDKNEQDSRYKKALDTLASEIEQNKFCQIVCRGGANRNSPVANR